MATPEPAPAAAGGSRTPTASRQLDWVEVAAGPRQAALVDALGPVLRAAGHGIGTGGKVNELRTRLHLRAEAARTLVAALSDTVAAQQLTVGLRQGTTATSWEEASRLARRDRLKQLNVWVAEHPVVGAAGTGTGTAEDGVPGDDAQAPWIAASVLEFDLWQRSENPVRHTAPRSNDVATTLDEPTVKRWLDPKSGPRPLDGVTDGRNLYARDFPIDVVYTWVDDADPAWRAQRDAYVPAEGSTRAPELADGRFRSRDELRYSLRSLESFAPFVRTVHLVTMGQRPDWLVADHPDLHLVDHRELWPDAGELPTFDPSAIESRLHHIENLAEQFLYVHDDVFWGRPCAWSEFFLANGAPRFFLDDSAFAPGPAGESDDAEVAAARTGDALLAPVTGTRVHKLMQHGPYPARRSVLAELEERFADAYRTLGRSRFRGPDDFRPISFLAPHYAFADGRSVPSRLEYRLLALRRASLPMQLSNTLSTRRYKTFCLNDGGVPTGRTAQVDRAVAAFLAAYFPFPSRFERTD